MAAKGRHRHIVLAAVPLLFALACRLCPGLAALALRRLSRPGMRALHRFTAPLPFPLSEALVLGLVALASFTLPAAALRAAARRDARPLRRWLRASFGALLALTMELALLWGPALLAPAEAVPEPDAARLEALCGELIDALNGAALEFPSPAESLRLAPAVAGMPGCAVKAARYPEWMRAAGISGLFVPLTGEALVDAGAPEALIPFTATHELAHLAGVADEGAANLIAWDRCLSAGGAFADSARLWALRYALGLLRRADPAACRRALESMKDPLSQVFHRSGGEAACLPARTFSLSRGDYAALAGYLAHRLRP